MSESIQLIAATYLEDHGLVGIVGYSQLEVASGEAEASRPVRFQLGHLPYCLVREV